MQNIEFTARTDSEIRLTGEIVGRVSRESKLTKERAIEIAKTRAWWRPELVCDGRSPRFFCFREPPGSC